MRTRVWIIGAAMAALTGCGHIFPAGERLLPETYGPPFGRAEIEANRPHHPHNPAADERHAAADPEESRRYRSHSACHAALQAAVAPHHGSQIVRVSSIETIGLYEAGGEVHEHRCADYVLSRRSWCVTASGGDHGQAHKREESACKSVGEAH